MTDRIYLVSDDETLKPMEVTPYSSEDLLQRLLEQYPDLLAGEQVDPDDPRRWLLVKREAGIEHDGDETHRWRLDHLFLDQDGVPTLVETKIAGKVKFESIRTVKHGQGALIAIGHHGEVEILDEKDRVRARYQVPYGARLKVGDGKPVANHAPLFEWDPYASPILSDRNGTVQFIDIVERSGNILPKPFHLIAHSTGCSISLEYLYNAETNAFDQIIFLAPLIQHEH